MSELILKSLHPSINKVRLHESGDFFSQEYFDAWINVARYRPNTLFYAYTKALPFWLNRMNAVNTLSNFVLTASYGGTHDHLIAQHKLRFAKVVYSIQEAEELGLEIDHDDSLASANGKSFALLLHGVQHTNSEASKAVSELRKVGWYGYGKMPLPLILTG
jgi:hypothetical protein